MNEYIQQCQHCGSRNLRVTHVELTLDVPLTQEGFDFTSVKCHTTNNEIVRCRDCGKQTDLWGAAIG